MAVSKKQVKKQISNALKSQKPALDKATIHSVDAMTASIKIGSSANIIKNVECVGGTDILYPGLEVNIGWVDNRPVVLSSTSAAIGPQGPAGPQGLPGEEGPQGIQGPSGADGIDGADGGMLYPQGRLAIHNGYPNVDPNTYGNTIYYTPYLGDDVVVYDIVDNEWKVKKLTQKSYTRTWATSTNYDVFLVYDHNTDALSLSVTAWASSGAGTSARATGIVVLNGRYVKDGANNYLYLGTIRTSIAIGGIVYVHDEEAKRFVWNAYNQIPRRCFLGALSASSSSDAVGSCFFIVGLTQTVIGGIKGKFTGTSSSYSAGYLVRNGAAVSSSLTEAGIWSRLGHSLASGSSVPVYCTPTGMHQFSLGFKIEASGASLAEGQVWALINQ